MPISPSAPSACPLVLLLYSQSPTLRLLFLLQSIASLASLIGLAFGIFLLLSRPFVSLHQGTTVLLLNLCLSLLLGNVGVLLSSLYHLHVPLFRPTSTFCFWLSFSFGDCLMIRSLFNVSLFSVYLSGVCFALERIIGSLLLLRSRRTELAIALSLAIFQWLLSLLSILPPKLSFSTLAVFAFSAFPATSSPLFPHCALLTPSPTQLHPHFFVLLGMQAFVLAIFSILTYHNHFDPMTKRELSRHNLTVHAQVLATELSLPVASSVVAFFLLNTLLDHSFLWAITNIFGGEKSNKNEEKGGEEALREAIWSEFQTLTLPLASFLFVGVFYLQNRNGTSTDGEEMYERMGNGGIVKEESKEVEQNEGREIKD